MRFVRGCRAEASNAWTSDNKSQIWATFRWKSTIGHKRNILISKSWYKNLFYVWLNSNFFAYWPPLTSNILRGQTENCKKFQGLILFFTKMLKTIAAFQHFYFFLVRPTFQLKVYSKLWWRILRVHSTRLLATYLLNHDLYYNQIISLSIEHGLLLWSAVSI